MKNKNKILVELDIESLGFEGAAIARKEGKVYMVKGAVPGDKVVARILKSKKNYAEATVESVIEPSVERIKAECSYFDYCGGCTLQNLEYESQLKWKRRNIIDSFERIGKFNVPIFEETLPSPEPFHYRNKMDFSFSSSRWLSPEEISSGETLNKDFALGLHAPGRYDKALDIDKCFLQPEEGNRILNRIREKALETGASAYDTINHKGFLRSLILRFSHFTDDLMAILVTNSIETDADEAFLEWYYHETPKEMPDNYQLLHAWNDTRNPVTYKDGAIIKGEGVLFEDILGIKFRISPFSFFQTNSAQLNRFIGKILNYAEINSDDIVWDLYCGAGSITLPAAKQAKHVYGIEIVKSAVDDARHNAELNGIENVSFYDADLHGKYAPSLLDELPQPDIILIDPPRAGMHPNLVEHLKKFSPRKIVYVSCNHTTQSRDCNILRDKYYPSRVAPVDMFPHTFHVESIAELLPVE